MGLFDFIKKKLFGKTKKVEESEKVKKKEVAEKKKESPKVKPKPEKPKVEKKPVPKKKKTDHRSSLLSEKTECPQQGLHTGEHVQSTCPRL